MKYTIQNIRHEPSDLDADVACFRYEVHFTEPEHAVTPYFFDMASLKKHLQSANPEFYRFYESTRRGLDLFGPAEIQTLDAMGEEGLQQLYAHLEEYLMACDWIPSLLEQVLQRRRRPTNEAQAAHQKAEEIFDELSGQAAAIRNDTARNRQFCNEANRALRQIAFNIYPEIAEMEPDVIKDFRYFFVTDILQISDRMDKLVNGG